MELLTLFLTSALAGSIPDALGPLADQVVERTGTFLPVLPRGSTALGVVNGQILYDGNDEVVALAGIDPSSGQAYVFCSGSLIHERWVLTAAHCIEGGNDVADYGLDLVVLWGGDIVGTGYSEMIPWERGIADPSYSSAQFINDAGLVELAEPKRDTQWMVLRDEPLDDTFVGTELTFYGFGITTDYGNDSGVKRTTKMPVETVGQFNVEAFAPGTNVCSGDSGGPSTFEGPDGPEQVGINAFVEVPCSGGRNGSTRVDNHIDWIRSYVPDVALDYADLPKDEPPPGSGPGEGGGRSWDDLGADDSNGLGGHWAPGTSVGGCAVAPSGAPGAWLLAAGVLALRARRR